MNLLLTMGDRFCGHNDYGVVLDPELLEQLDKICTVHRRPGIKDSAELSKVMQETQAEIIIPFWGDKKVTMEVYKDNPQFKYLCNPAGGIKGYIDLEVMEAGVTVTNWGTLTADSVAEGALMMILSALRRTTKLTFDMHTRKTWTIPEAVKPEGLLGQTVGLHGLGAIAQELVKLLKPFGCTISAYSPHCPDDVFESLGVKRAESLESIYADNRVVSVHASKTKANEHIVNKDILAKMQDGAVLVNTARGAVIDTEALIAELKTGRIEAALDVFEVEPLEEDSPLRGLENCMLIPHHAGPTADRRRVMGEFCVKQVERFVKGEPLENVVKPEKYHLMT